MSDTRHPFGTYLMVGMTLAPGPGVRAVVLRSPGNALHLNDCDRAIGLCSKCIVSEFLIANNIQIGADICISQLIDRKGNHDDSNSHYQKFS